MAKLGDIQSERIAGAIRKLATQWRTEIRYTMRYRVPLPAPSLATRPRDARAFRMRVVLSLLKPLLNPISARTIRMLRLISSMSLRSSRVALPPS